MRIISFLIIISILIIGCSSDNFYNTRRVISTDKDQYSIGDEFELTLTIIPIEREKEIRIYDNFKNLEISFALVNPEREIQNEDWSMSSGQFLDANRIMDLTISQQKPFTKTFKGEIIDDNTNFILSIQELKMTATFHKSSLDDGTYIRIHGFCNPIDPEFGASLEEHFESKDIRITETLL